MEDSEENGNGNGSRSDGGDTDQGVVIGVSVAAAVMAVVLLLLLLCCVVAVVRRRRRGRSGETSSSGGPRKRGSKEGITNAMYACKFLSVHSLTSLPWLLNAFSWRRC